MSIQQCHKHWHTASVGGKVFQTFFPNTGRVPVFIALLYRPSSIILCTKQKYHLFLFTYVKLYDLAAGLLPLPQLLPLRSFSANKKPLPRPKH